MLYRLGHAYVDNVVAYIDKRKVSNPITGQLLEPDEKLMRSVEKEANIGEALVDDFRRQVATQIGCYAVKGKQWTINSNLTLVRALKSKLTKDIHNHISLKSLVLPHRDPGLYRGELGVYSSDDVINCEFEIRR